MSSTTRTMIGGVTTERTPLAAKRNALPRPRPMIQPVKAAQHFYQARVGALADAATVIAEATLASWLVDAHRLLPDADLEGRWVIWTLIGLILQRQGRLADALEAYEKARSLNPTNPNSAINVGNIHGLLGDHPKALECLDEAERFVRNDPGKLSIIHLNRLAAFKALGDLARATASLRLAAEATPEGDLVGNQRLAMSSASLGYDDDAVEYVARALCLGARVARGDRPAIEVVQALLRGGGVLDPVPPVVARSIARVTALSSPVSESELQSATERARGDDGLVDPFALAEALSTPMYGSIRAGDPGARFGSDLQVVPPMVDDA